MEEQNAQLLQERERWGRENTDRNKHSSGMWHLFAFLILLDFALSTDSKVLKMYAHKFFTLITINEEEMQADNTK